MKKKTLFIHIGCEKTGTTTIQRTLAANRLALREQGILYPEFGKNPVGHFSLPASLHYLDHTTSSSPGYYDVDDVTPDDEWQKFVHLCLQHQDVNIIVSAEHFSSRVGDKGLAFMQRKLAALTPYFTIKFVIFLRRQDLFLESSFSTAVKSGSTTPFDEFVTANSHFQRRYNFKHLMDRWLNYFEKDMFIVKEYDDCVKSAGLLETFYRITGINSTGLTLPEKSHNSSWSRSMIDLALLCNSQRISSILKRQRLGFLASVAELPQFKNDKARYKLTPTQRLEMLNFYLESNRAIEQEFFAGAPLLSAMPDYEKADDTTYDPAERNLTRMDILALFATYATQQVKDL